MSVEPVATCFLCRASTGAVDLPWWDRPLWLDPRCGVVVPGLGGLSVGYVLLSPLEHHTSLVAAVPQQRAYGHDFVGFVQSVLSYLEAKFGRLTFWEHGGTTDPSVRRSACVEHAHLHIVPGALELPLPPDHSEHSGIGMALSALAGRNDRNDTYLLMGYTSGPCFTGRDVRVSQYYRREWARLLGKGDNWDYLISEDHAITRETIKMFLCREE
jgi:hypothetical protein